MCNDIKKDYKPIGPTNLYSYFIGENPITSFNPVSMYPRISESVSIGPFSSVIGNVIIENNVFVGNNTFVGFNSIVFNAIVEDNCYIDTGAIVTGGIKIAANRYVPIGAIINTQAKSDALLEVSKEQSDFSKKVIKVNVELSKAYDLKFGDTRCTCGLCCNHNTLIHN